MIGNLYEVDENGKLKLALHRGQSKAWESDKRFVFVYAGTQSGKTSFGPFWLWREIQKNGAGDYLAVTSTFPLLRLKMLPEFLKIFHNTFRAGKWWAADRVYELANPETGEMASRATDPMWGRVIFGSAKNADSLESATAKVAWIDECLAPDTLIDTEIGKISIGKIVNNHIPLRVWSFDIEKNEWELRPIIRWIRLPQQQKFIRIGNLCITPNHKIWTREYGYIEISKIASAWYNTGRAKEIIHVKEMRILPKETYGKRSKEVLQSGMFLALARKTTRGSEKDFRGEQTAFSRPSRICTEDFGESEKEICQPSQSTLGSDWRRFIRSFNIRSQESIYYYKNQSGMETGWEWTTSELATRKIGNGIGMAERICCSDGQWMVAPCLQDRCCRTYIKNRNRGWECCQPTKNPVVCGEWVDIFTLLEQNGGDMDGGLSSDGQVYNLEVEGNHNYIANNILVANCGQNQFRLDAWEAILRRLSLNRGRVLGTTTLYNWGWMKQQIYDPWRRGENADIDVVQFKSIDNPSFPRDEYYRAKRTMPSWRFKMFYEGQYDKPAGMIYDSFDFNTQVVPAFNIPHGWPLYVGIDFGGVHMAGLFVAQNPDTKAFYHFHEYLAGGRSISQHAEEFKKIVGDRPFFWVGGAAPEDQWRLEFREAGIPVMPPPIKDVEVGIQRVYGYHRRNQIFVFNTCTRYLDQKGSYSRELDDNNQPTDEIEDKNVYHLMDAERVLFAYLWERQGGPSMEIMTALGTPSVSRWAVPRPMVVMTESAGRNGRWQRGRRF